MSNNNFNGNIANTLEALYLHGYISPDQYREGLDVCEQTDQPNPQATVGFEVEITRESIGKTAYAYSVYGVRHDIENLGFKYTDDEEYEMSSPPSTHPRALHHATIGLVNAGLLPASTDKSAPEHISIGVETGFYRAEALLAMVGISRATEIIGCSTPQRLMQPLLGSPTPATDKLEEVAWNNKGVGGILWQVDPRATTVWQGSQSRVEYRSFAYQDPSSHAKTLDALYYLTRACFDTTYGDAHAAYTAFKARFDEYRVANNLPASWSDGTYDRIYTAWDQITKHTFRQYMEPYANAANRQDPKLAAIVRTAVLDIRDAYGYGNISTPFEQRAA